MTGTDVLAAVAAEREITQKLMQYCQGVDRKRYDLLADCYHSDALDSHGPYVGDVPGFVEWVRRRHEHVGSSMHLLGNVAIRLSDDGRRARVETYCITHQYVLPGADDPFGSADAAELGTRLTIAARYVDTFEHRDGVGWKILLRTVVYEWTKREDARSYLPVDPSWTSFRRDGQDPLFAPLDGDPRAAVPLPAPRPDGRG